MKDYRKDQVRRNQYIVKLIHLIKAASGTQFLGVVVDRLLLESDRMNSLNAGVQISSKKFQPCVSGLA